jgi:hypothetical protein
MRKRAWTVRPTAARSAAPRPGSSAGHQISILRPVPSRVVDTRTGCQSQSTGRRAVRRRAQSLGAASGVAAGTRALDSSIPLRGAAALRNAHRTARLSVEHACRMTAAAAQSRHGRALRSFNPAPWSRVLASASSIARRRVPRGARSCSSSVANRTACGRPSGGQGARKPGANHALFVGQAGQGLGGLGGFDPSR